MFCTYCQQTRPENEAPCPKCGAPSPLLQISGTGQWGTNNSTGIWTEASSGLSNNSQNLNAWGGTATHGASPQATGAQWEQTSTNQPTQQQPSRLGQTNSLQPPMPMGSQAQWEAPAFQHDFDQANAAPSSLNPSWSQMPPSATGNQNMSGWTDNGAEQQETSQSLLPMIYQGGMPQAGETGQSTVSLQLVPEHAVEHLLPAVSEVPESVYVPPLYTKPRPLTPRYRIISGTLSVLIVVLVLCGAAGYYAQTSGTLAKIGRIFTGAPPAAITPTTVNPGNPPDQIDSGPAQNVITSGTTTARVDNNVALETDKVFTVNKAFYVTYTVQPPAGEDGKVSVKWYMNGQFYSAVIGDTLKAGSGTWNESVQMQYPKPTQGSVELYWNDQLALRFYFAVK